MLAGGWRETPAHGVADPAVLVLGFTKGARQSRGIGNAVDFDAIPFRGMRHNDTKVLVRLSVLGPGDEIDNHICADGPDFAFGSLIRCSVSKLDAARSRYVKSGDVIQALAREGQPDYIFRCAERCLGLLPPRLRVVVMLGNASAYVEACKVALTRLHPDLNTVNPVAYRTGPVTWVHVVHPSGASGRHCKDWLTSGDGVQAQKRGWAIAAVAASGAIDTTPKLSRPR